MCIRSRKFRNEREADKVGYIEAWISVAQRGEGA